ncbi:MAG: type IX secretion system sortase PorU [Bacteroidota bacterium]
MLRTVIFTLLICWFSLSSGQPFASQSVLSTGEWYKIGVTESGIYRIDQDFLNELGISASSINPKNIKIFGNGGAMLSQRNADFRHDDLTENPIFVSGESDNSFDASDYLLFYGESAHTWKWNSSLDRFTHKYHLYADTNYYYLTVSNDPGKRIEQMASEPNPDFVVSATRNAHFHELDKENPLKSGRHWLGERFELTSERTYAYSTPDVLPSGKIRVTVRVAAHADVPTKFVVKNGSTILGTLDLQATNIISKEARYYYVKQQTYQLDPSAISSDDSVRITLSYDRNGSNRAEGWLDWMEVEYDQELNSNGQDNWFFRLSDQSSPDQVASFSIQNGSSSHRIWDISDPTHVQEQQFQLNGTTMEFNVLTENTKSFIAFSAGFLQPVSSEKIVNQNLHGMSPVDYIVITHPDFKSQADRLAQFHQEYYGRTTAVIFPSDIYNEFSSGKQDVSAIRDFIRMMYVRTAGTSPGFITMFGDGSYVYKNISQNLTNATNYVPTYQSRDSWDPTDSYTSDDFFGIMGQDEGFWGENSQTSGDLSYEVNQIDIPVGRLPVSTEEEATQVVDKIVSYATDPDGTGLGQWRNQVVLVADHKEGEGNTHVRQANGYSSQIHASNPCINIEKIFMDNYKMEITAGQEGFPEGREALLASLDEGSLIVNYTGHGGEQAWSNAHIFRNSDIDKLQNQYRYPAVITATCEFGRYDDPDLQSGAELMTLASEAGAIALFTTVRLVYSSPNEALNKNFYRHVFTFDSLRMRMPTLGEVMMRTKNATFTRGNLANINSRNFTLLGDPGLILNYPKKRARMTSINDRPISEGVTDSLRSLSLINVKGVLEDELGNPLPNFEGEMDITVFDKPSLFTTRLSSYSFFWQKNRIFNGKTTVKEGQFEFEFVVPIDISYENGQGKISVYFFNKEIDGAGCYNNLHVGGTDDNAIVDEQGPKVQLFINDEDWINGGITSPNPSLYALVEDESGINTVGSGIGHEISAVLDENSDQVFNLNDYYTAESGSYQRGSVKYPLRDLPLGEHTLRIRVWDVANNASEDTTVFIVSDNAIMALDRVLTAPNPLTSQAGETRFMIGHNQDGQDLQVQIEIISMTGQLVKSLSADFMASGNNFADLSWDGTDDRGNQLSNGVYVYRVSVQNLELGQKVHTTERLVLLK